MSSGFGEVGVKCLSIVEYCQGTSSPGSFLIHSIHFNACASSNVARLGVISEVGSHVEGISKGSFTLLIPCICFSKYADLALSFDIGSNISLSQGGTFGNIGICDAWITDIVLQWV